MLKVHGITCRQEDCCVVARVWATSPDGVEFLADFFFEIDGRDFEFEKLWGGDMTGPYFDDICDHLYECDKWEAISQAMEASMA